MTSASVPTIRATGPADLLALVPYLLGFQPEESICAILLSGSQLKLTARVDLPSVEVVEAAADGFGHRVAEQAERDQVDQIIVAVFSEDGELARRALLELVGAGLPVVLALHSDGSQYRVLEGEEMTPPQDYEPSATIAAASAVAAGLAPVHRRDDLLAMVDFDQDQHHDAMEGARCLDHFDESQDLRLLMRRTVQAAIRGPMLPRDIALLALLALDIEARDSAWLMMDRTNAQDHLTVWLTVARAMKESLAAGPAVLAGMAAWLSGNGALAWCCVDRAQDEFEGYGFAGLLAEILDQALHPDNWVELRPQLMEAAQAA